MTMRDALKKLVEKVGAETRIRDLAVCLKCDAIFVPYGLLDGTVKVSEVKCPECGVIG